MSQKIYEEEPGQGKPSQKSDEEYDVYLFWPSLSNGDVSSHPSPLYGPISLHSESTDFDPSVCGSGPPSPIMFAPVLDRQFPLPLEEGLDFGAALPEEPNPGAQVRKESPPPPKYSPIVNMGLFLSQISRRFDHAIEGVKLKLRKPKEPEL